jgi:DNA-directed RNA polymerase specialized sigma24 family protein
MTLVRTGQRWATAQTAPEAYAHRVLINLLHDRHRGLARRVTERPLDGHDEGRSPLRDHADTVADRDAIVRRYDDSRRGSARSSSCDSSPT